MTTILQIIYMYIRSYLGYGNKRLHMMYIILLHAFIMKKQQAEQ